MEDPDQCNEGVLGARPRIHTVFSLTQEIRELLEDHFEFVWVEGEISNFRAPGSGHLYMSLKDEKAQIRAVMFRMQARCLRFLPEDGMKIIAQGRLAVYEPRGEYQLVLEYLEPLGVGALALAFEQLKRKLSAQGLFDPAVKKPLPYLPQRVAVITSPTGAAVRDFIRVVRRRFSNLEIIIVPVKVQGEGAACEIASALALVNESLPVDVIVLTRGGGSLEDLWAFNEERGGPGDPRLAHPCGLRRGARDRSDHFGPGGGPARAHPLGGCGAPRGGEGIASGATREIAGETPLDHDRHPPPVAAGGRGDGQEDARPEKEARGSLDAAR